MKVLMERYCMLYQVFQSKKHANIAINERSLEKTNNVVWTIPTQIRLYSQRSRLEA